MSAQVHSGPVFDPAANSRRAYRSRALKHGRIVFNHGYGVFDCVIRNLSDRGAMLVLPAAANLPDRFELRLEATPPTRMCAVRWRSQDFVGVEFEDF